MRSRITYRAFHRNAFRAVKRKQKNNTVWKPTPTKVGSIYRRR